jgi:hypothetical protein
VTTATPAQPTPHRAAGVGPGLWLFDCDELAGHLLRLDDDGTALSPNERTRAARIGDEQQRLRWVCARIALRRSLGVWSGVPLERRDFDVTAQGRPHLPSPAPSFSLSHTGRYVLIAVCGSAHIGADIEQIAPRKIAPERRARLTGFALRLADGAALDAWGDEHGRFIQAWCRIEASAKAEGCGVGRLLTRAGLMGPSSGRPHSSAHTKSAAHANGPSEPPAQPAMRAIDLDISRLAPGHAAALAARPDAVAAWGDALAVEDGAALLPARH